MDEIIVMYLVIAGAVFSIFTLGIGRLLDPIYRVKLLRKLTKKNFIILAIMSDDRKNIDLRVVNANSGVIRVNNFAWIMKKDRIYREDKTNMGFIINQTDIKYREGVPIVYVDRDNIKPISFIESKTNIRPEELGVNLDEWVETEKEKDKLASKNMQMIITGVTIIILLGALFFAYSANDKSEQILNRVISIDQVFHPITNETQPVGAVLPYATSFK